MKTYSELILLPTIKERFNYLKCKGKVGDATFGGSRWLNQIFYNSDEWRMFRDEIIIRDGACDLAVEGYELKGKIYIHHIIPITKEDILKRNISKLLNPENCICCSFNTHQAIHYGDENLLPQEPIIRRPNDQCPWR